MERHARPLALVTGASSGIGYHLALCAANAGYDLLVAADTPLAEAAAALRAASAEVETVETDLARQAGVDHLCEVLGDRDIALLMANAGHGRAGPFLDTQFAEQIHVIDTNVTGTLYLLHRLVPRMVARHAGRIMITGSVAGLQPGSFHAVYNGSKAFIDSFAIALRNELRESAVTVTCLMPGPTDTEFFARAEMLDTRAGHNPKQDPAAVAHIGFTAMMTGDADVITGWHNKLVAFAARVLPREAMADMQRRLAEPLHSEQHGVA